jgi:hypothetical protein
MVEERFTSPFIKYVKTQKEWTRVIGNRIFGYLGIFPTVFASITKLENMTFNIMINSPNRKRAEFVCPFSTAVFPCSN